MRGALSDSPLEPLEQMDSTMSNPSILHSDESIGSFTDCSCASGSSLEESIPNSSHLHTTSHLGGRASPLHSESEDTTQGQGELNPGGAGEGEGVDVEFHSHTRGSPRPRTIDDSWWGREEEPQLKLILRKYSALLHLNRDRAPNSREPEEFIGTVSRVITHPNTTDPSTADPPQCSPKKLRSYDLVSVCVNSVNQAAHVPVGRRLPVKHEYRVITSWDDQDGLPISVAPVDDDPQLAQAWGEVTRNAAKEDRDTLFCRPIYCPWNHKQPEGLFEFGAESRGKGCSSSILDEDGGGLLIHPQFLALADLVLTRWLLANKKTMPIERRGEEDEASFNCSSGCGVGSRNGTFTIGEEEWSDEECEDWSEDEDEDEGMGTSTSSVMIGLEIVYG